MLPMHAPNMVPVCLRKGAWSEEEDLLLRKCIEKFGEGKWRQVPLRAGLNRCRKSCRLRWLNYLQPNIKRGEFSPDEIDLIIRMHKLLGNRWSLIAGRLPGRTANDIKNYCNSHLKKMISSSPWRLRNNKSIDYDYKKVVKTDNRHGNHHQPEQKKKKILKPQPRTFPKNSHWIFNNNNNNNNNTSTFIPRSSSNSSFNDQLSRNEETTTTPTSNTLWLKNILFQDNADQGQNNNEGGEKSFCDIDGDIIKDDLWSSDMFDDSLWRLLAGDENLN